MALLFCGFKKRNGTLGSRNHGLLMPTRTSDATYQLEDREVDFLVRLEKVVLRDVIAFDGRAVLVDAVTIDLVAGPSAVDRTGPHIRVPLAPADMI